MDGSTNPTARPNRSKGAPSRLFHNLGNGKFEEVGKKAGIADPTSKSLGVSVLDFDNDGWPDIFVSNDTQPNKLFRNNHDGTFTEARCCRRGRLWRRWCRARRHGCRCFRLRPFRASALARGEFSNQMLGLYHNEGTGLFVDEAPSSSVGRASLLSLTFGVFFFDYDLDGYPDIFAVNGHTEEDIERIQPKVKFSESPLLFRNLGRAQIRKCHDLFGPDFSPSDLAPGRRLRRLRSRWRSRYVGQHKQWRPCPYQNDGGNRNNWLAVRLIGSKSNRSALGAVVRLQSALGKQWQTVHSGSSYCSQSDLTLTFGLGKDSAISVIDVEWPSGQRQHFKGLSPNRLITIDETKGVL